MQFKIHEGVKNDLNHDSTRFFFYEFCIFDILRENQSAFGSQFFFLDDFAIDLNRYFGNFYNFNHFSEYNRLRKRG